MTNFRSFDSRLYLVDAELDTAAESFWLAGQKLETAIMNAIPETHLNRSQLSLLYLVRSKPGIDMSTARYLSQMSVPNFARLVAKLDSDALLTRRADSDDGRRKTLTLTESGMALTEPMAQAARDILRRVFRRAGPEAVDATRAIWETM